MIIENQQTSTCLIYGTGQSSLCPHLAPCHNDVDTCNDPRGPPSTHPTITDILHSVGGGEEFEVEGTL